jgi:hypothetical protein
VDRDLGQPGKPVSPYLALLTIFLGVHAARGSSLFALIIGGILVTLGVVASIFVGWRAYRVIKAISFRAGRRYERVERYALPPEYATSESSILARLRRKATRNRS